MSHFSHDTSTNKRIASAEANKIYSLYISDAAPLKVDLGEDIPVEIKKVQSNTRSSYVRMQKQQEEMKRKGEREKETIQLLHINLKP